MLKRSDGPLSRAYDVAVLDLDGVVYVGPSAVPGAPEALDAAAEAGMHLAFVTNNAARPPEEVAAHLVELGVHARAEDVVTSAQAAARLVSRAVPRGAEVFVMGGEGLHQALAERGLRGVTEASDEVAAVAQGYGPDMPWRQVVAGAILVKAGLPWVASNTDLTIPTEGGTGPGNGTLVRLVAEFAEREPEVAGKPKPPLFEETLERVGGERPLVVGDRLDTDIEGANAVGWDSLLVFTGVTDAASLVAAPEQLRPTYVGAGLAALADDQPQPETRDGQVSLGGWHGRVEEGVLTVEGAGSADDWWRVVATAGWRHLDEAGQPVEVSGLRPPG